MVPLAVAWAGVCGAQDIHKCVDIGNGGVAYQNAPCSGVQFDAGHVRLPGYADPPQRDGAMAPPVDAPQATAPDDTRDSSMNPATDVPRELSFVDGRLTSIGVGTSSVRVASAAQ